jgi:hypothetical protein
VLEMCQEVEGDPEDPNDRLKILKSDHASWLAVSCDPNHLMYIDASSPSIDSLLNQLFQPSTSCVQEGRERSARRMVQTRALSHGSPISAAVIALKWSI